MTDGKFSNALEVFVRMLQIVPLMVVETRKEVDEVWFSVGLHSSGSIEVCFSVGPHSCGSIVSSNMP